MEHIEKASAAIASQSFESLGSLTALLDARHIEYVLTLEDNPAAWVEPHRCKLPGVRGWKLFFLRLSGTSGPKTFRYRIYVPPEGNLCIEEDFAFKNPYQET
jgi:hypothetical protein